MIGGIWLILVAGALAGTPLRGNPREKGVVPQEDELYVAVIDTVYHPLQYANQYRRGVVLLQMQSESGAVHLSDPSIITALRRVVPPGMLDSLLTSYRAANATSHWLDGHLGYVVGSTQETFLDSSTVRHILAPGAEEPMKESVVTDVLAGLPLDSLPGILSLSIPGITPDANTAMLYATLRERRSVEPGHLEAAAFLILSRDGMRWSLAAEVPVGGARY